MPDLRSTLPMMSAMAATAINHMASSTTAYVICGASVQESWRRLPRSAKQGNLSSSARSAYGRQRRWRGRAFQGERLHPSAYVVRQIFAGGISHYLSSMTAQPAQPELRELAQDVATTASTPLARFVPGAPAVPDQMVDQWVEQELRGRCSVRAGLAMLACLAVVAIPLVLWF